MFESDVPLLTQLLGYAAVVMLFVSFQSNDRNRILMSLIIGVALLTAHQFLLGALVGAFANGLTIVRNVSFRFRDRYFVLQDQAWPYFYSLILVAASLLLWQDWYSILPALAVIASTFALWASEPRRIRVLSYLGPLLWIPYAITIDSLPTLLLQIVILFSLVVAQFRFDRTS